MAPGATLKTKLMSGLGVVVLAALIGTGYSVSLIHGLTSVVSNAARIHQLGKLAENSANMVGLSRAIVLHTIFDDKVKVEEFKRQFAEASQSFNETLGTASQGASGGDQSAFENLRRKQDEWVALHNEVMASLASQQVDVAEKKVADQAFMGTADEIRRLADDMAANGAANLSQKAAAANTQSLIGSVTLVVVSLGLGVFVLIYIRRISNELTVLTESLADNSGEVAKLSAEVRSGSESLAKASSEQAASLEETAASAEDVTTMTRKNAQNSKAAADVMSTVDGHIKACNGMLEEMMTSMRDINDSSAKISRIIKVIDEIAFQTNILALNAAVEAARAGEAGAGFAVVADEVRSLAQRSAEAARDTAQLIEESIAKSQDGSSKLQQVTQGILAVTNDSSQVKLLVDEVSAGSEEQSRGIEQIARAVSHMDQGTQGAAASAQQSAAASVELLAQAGDLQNIVLQLRSLVGVGAAS